MLTAEQRFQKFLRRDDATGCLIWGGARDPWGYGRFRLNGRTMILAHRAAFLFSGGEISADRPCVLHSCDTPACCEPAHLFAGTHAENAADRVRKDRSAKSRRGLPFGVSLQGSWFEARIWRAGKMRYLGRYDTVGEAAAVAQAAAAKETNFTNGRVTPEGASVLL